MIFAKNFIKFFEGITNEELLSKLFLLLSKRTLIFKDFPKIRKQLIKIVIRICCTTENMKIKFCSFVFIRGLFSDCEDEVKIYITKKLIEGYISSNSDLSLRKIDL